jgi:putative glutamine amidotransferase
MSKLIGLTLGENTKPYEDAMRRVGLEPVRLTTASLDGLSGLFVTGGADIDPKRYGDPKHKDTEEPDLERDALEAAVLEKAIARDMPVLCVCRGLQMLNVVLGGALIQHLPTVDKHRQKGVYKAHAITLTEGTRLNKAFGATTLEVNSRHHQAIDPLRKGSGLIVTALSDDNVIEAAEMPDKHFVVGVQWHPEDRLDDDLPLFEAFAKAVS